MSFSIFSNGVATSRWISLTIIKENGHYNGVTTIQWVFPQLQGQENLSFYFFLMESPHLGGYLSNYY